MNLAAWIRRSSRDNNLNRFCVEPFSGLDITHSGRVYMCCADWRPVPVGNMLETPLMDIWMGKPASDLRSSILDQSFRFCRATCPLLENPRGPVRIGSAPPALPSLDRLIRLTLSYDPTCTLKCPSCRTAHLGSSENTELIHRMVIQSGILQRTNLLYIAGDGDPIASPLYWSLLRSLDPLPLNPKLAVRLHTNGLRMERRAGGEERCGSAAGRMVAGGPAQISGVSGYIPGQPIPQRPCVNAEIPLRRAAMCCRLRFLA